MPLRTLVTQAAPRRFVLAFAVAAVLALVPAAVMALYFGPIDGDLARIGHLVERDFGPRHPQPPIERIAPPRADERADIVLLGDSFSQANAWQSEFSRLTGKRIASWQTSQVHCTADWIDKAIAGQLRSGARIVIVQSVERSFTGRFRERSNCAKDFYPEHQPETGPFGLAKHPWAILPLDGGHVIRSALRYREARAATGRYRAGEVVMVDLARQDLFSSARPGRLLYFADDEIKFGEWSDDKADALLLRLQGWRQRAAAAGVTLLFLTIPDKSSVYWPWIKPDQQLPYPQQGEQLFTLIGARLGEQYNLLPYLREQAAAQTDLHRPDDTHFSLVGYRLLAARVAQWVPADSPTQQPDR